MKRPPCLTAVILVLAFSPEIFAQIYVAPAPILVPGPPLVFVPGGVTIIPRRPPGILIPVGPSFGTVTGQVVVRVIGPAPRPRTQEVDLSGVDLDVVGPEALQPGFKPNVAKIPQQPANKKLLERIELAKQPEMPAKPQVMKEPPKKELPPPAKIAPPPPPAKPANLLEPRAEPLEESRRLTELGLIAFSGREYGLALRRFQQAAEAEQGQPRPYFLLAQTYLALGQYREAVAAIEKGMRRQPNWPLSGFQPRVDLYKGIEDDWFTHQKQLAEVVTLRPDRAVYLFLAAYQLWFDGQRDQAADLFAHAKILAPDNVFINEFLKVVPKVTAK
jgi:Tetratricopeptide repeat